LTRLHVDTVEPKQTKIRRRISVLKKLNDAYLAIAEQNKFA
jgi:hypothetical protein